MCLAVCNLRILTLFPALVQGVRAGESLISCSLSRDSGHSAHFDQSFQSESSGFHKVQKSSFDHYELSNLGTDNHCTIKLVHSGSTFSTTFILPDWHTGQKWASFI